MTDGGTHRARTLHCVTVDAEKSPLRFLERPFVHEGDGGDYFDDDREAARRFLLEETLPFFLICSRQYRRFSEAS